MGLAVELSGEKLEIVAADLLGPVHGHVGILDQNVRVNAVNRRDGDADAAGDKELNVFVIKGLAHGLEQPVRYQGDSVERINIRQKNQEFVTTLPGQRIPQAQQHLEPVGEFDQQLIASGMAKAVVDVLEVVQIEKHQRHLVALAVHVVQGHLQPVIEEDAVGQAGEGVMLGLMLQRFLLAFKFGNVVKNRDIVGDAPLLITHRVDGQPFGIDLAAFAAVPDLARPLPLCAELSPHLLIKIRLVFVGFEDLRILANCLFGAIAGDLAEGLIDLQDIALNAGNHDAFDGMLKNLGGKHQFFLSQLAYRDIPHHRQAVIRRLARPPHRRDRKDDPHDQAILADVTFFHCKFSYSVSNEIGPLLLVNPGIVGMGDIAKGLLQQFLFGIPHYLAIFFVHLEKTAAAGLNLSHAHAGQIEKGPEMLFAGREFSRPSAHLKIQPVIEQEQHKPDDQPHRHCPAEHMQRLGDNTMLRCIEFLLQIGIQEAFEGITGREQS